MKDIVGKGYDVVVGVIKDVVKVGLKVMSDGVEKVRDIVVLLYEEL